MTFQPAVMEQGGDSKGFWGRGGGRLVYAAAGDEFRRFNGGRRRRSGSF